MDWRSRCTVSSNAFAGRAGVSSRPALSTSAGSTGVGGGGIRGTSAAVTAPGRGGARGLRGRRRLVARRIQHDFEPRAA